MHNDLHPLYLYGYGRQHHRLAGEHLLRGHKGSKGRPLRILRAPQISEYNRNLSEMHWSTARERERERERER